MSDALRAERDLYLRLLELGSHDLGAFLDEALGLVCEVTGAKTGYLALGQQLFAVRLADVDR